MSTVQLPNIALIGKAGSGKTTTADILVRDYGYTKMSIAEPLKDIAAALWGDMARTDRGALQQLGVAVRQIEPDTWIDLLVNRMHDDGQSERFVVDDVRFANELDMLRLSSFAVVRLVANAHTRIDRLKANGKWQNEAQLEHESETALDRTVPDYELENDPNAALSLGGEVAKLLNRVQR